MFAYLRVLATYKTLLDVCLTEKGRGFIGRNSEISASITLPSDAAESRRHGISMATNSATVETAEVETSSELAAKEEILIQLLTSLGNR